MHGTYPCPSRKAARGSEGETQLMPAGPLRVLCVAKIAQPRKRHLAVCLTRLDKLDEPQWIAGLTLIGADTRPGIRLQPGTSLEQLDGQGAERTAEQSQNHLAGQHESPQDQMAEHYLSHHVSASLPVRQREPLGTSPLEAMAYGTVPLVSTATGSAGTVELAGDGMVFRAGDVDDLHARLAAFASDRQKLQTLGQQVREFAGDHLAPERFVEDLLQLIDDAKKR